MACHYTGSSGSEDENSNAANAVTQGHTEDATALRDLLEKIGAGAALEALRRECVDVESLKLMGNDELKEAGVPLGPRMKLLNTGVCQARRREKGEGTEKEKMWDMTLMSDVQRLQSVKPRLVLHMGSGRVHSSNGADVVKDGILVHEDDIPFIVLMEQVIRCLSACTCRLCTCRSLHVPRRS
jgi:hypothetical protein